ncbi:MAG: hypothetical protein ACFB15_22715 [Cyclobacteriaceae bacterium]
MKMNVTSWALGLLLTFTLFSCSKEDEQLSTEVGIIGKWTVQSADLMIDGKSYESYVEESINQLKQQLGENYSDVMGDEIEDLFADFDPSSEFENTTIEFLSDKTAIVTDEDGSQNGTWAADGKQLIVTFDNDTQEFTVRSLTSSEASLAMSSEFDDLDIEGMGIQNTLEVILNLKK